MIIVMKSDAKEEEIKKVKDLVESNGLLTNISRGESYYIVGVIGDTSMIDSKKVNELKGVDKVMRVQEPFKKANRLFKPEDTVVSVGNSIIGGGRLGVIAGPCSVESEEKLR